MAEAPRDQNHIPTVLLESSTNPGVVLTAKGDQVTGRLLVDVVSGGTTTVDAGTATGLPAGDPPTVTNSGTTTNAVFDFGIPAGAPGADGPTGPMPTINDTSVTSNDIGTGPKTFSVLATNAWVVGDWLVISETATPANYMTGNITAYSGPSVTVNVVAVGGSGTGITAWTLALSGVKGTDGAGAGTVTSVSVTSANGMAGTVATATSTPAITLSTSVTGVVKGNGTAFSAATDGTDYLSSTTGLKLDQTSSQTIANGQPVQGTLTASELVSTDANRKLQSLAVATYPSLTELSYVKGVTSAAQTQINSKQYYHGVVARPVGATNPLPANLTTTTFTLGATANPISYWYQGTLVNVTSDKTVQLNGGVTAPVGFYYIYFDAATGNILQGGFPGISRTSNVLIATVNWNGTDYGLVQDERHSFSRNCDWHEWAHDTIGARYQSGITLTASGSTTTSTLSTTSGAIHDEDIDFVVNASSTFPTANTCRMFWQTSATTYTFDNTPSPRPYKLGTGNRPVYVDSSNAYALTTINAAPNRFLNFFYYATTDLHTPIYCFVGTSTAALVANGYTSLANARAIPFPNLSSMNNSPELKPIYRVIVDGDGLVQAITAADDYRTVSSLPQSAGTVSTTASAVAYTPTGTVSAGNVQDAITELDTEKLALAGGTMTGNLLFTDNTLDIGASGATRPRTLYLGTSLIAPSVGLTGNRITNGWFADLTVTNAIAGGVTGNAGTVTTAAETGDTTCSIAFVTAVSGSLPLKTNTNLTFNASTGVLTSASAVLTTADINGGTVDGVTVATTRINPRIVTAASYTTDTGSSLTVADCDQFQVTAQAGALKFNNPGGTPLAGQKLIIRVKDDGTARALTYDTYFRAMGNALPSTTVLSKTLYMGFIFNATDTKWDCVAVSQEV